MKDVQKPDSFEAADYTGALRRRWWIVLALTCVGLVVAFGYLLVAPKEYTATAQVYVNVTGADQGSTVANSKTSGAVNLNTEAQLVQSGTVATIAGHMMHSSLTPYALSKELTVTVPPSSDLLDISCKAPTAAGAATCANDFAKAYLQNRSATATSEINTQLTSLDAKLKAEQQAMSALHVKITALPKNSPLLATDRTAFSSDKSQANSYSARIAELNNEAVDNSGGHITTTATPPGSPSSPKKLLVLPSGLVAGLVIGLIVALLWDRRDKKIHSARDVERLLDLPVMLELSEKSFGHQLSIASPRSVTGRAFTELAQSIGASLGEGRHVVLVAGAAPGPGGSVVAANLAATLARTHSDVVLVCADLGGTVAPELFGLDGGRGLVEVVAGTATVREVVCGPAALPGLWVIPPGSDPSLAVYNLQHDRVEALMSQLRRDARYVIIEARATADGADTFALAEFADAALLVIEVPTTTQPEANSCIRRLLRMQTMILGAAVLPSIGKRVGVRPLRQAEARPGPGQGNGSDGALAGRGDVAALSGSAARRDRPARSREGYGEPADSAPGR